jgi:mercuric ion transport protein
MSVRAEPYKRSFIAAVVGTAVVALCCFTPILVIAMAALGLGFFTPYLDYVLLPALVVLIIVSITAYRRWRQASALGETGS